MREEGLSEKGRERNEEKQVGTDMSDAERWRGGGKEVK